MPPFRDVEFPDVAYPDGTLLALIGGDSGNLRAEVRGPDIRTIASVLTPEQQDELWRRLGEARGHLPPASDTPKPWRDLAGGEG